MSLKKGNTMLSFNDKQLTLKYLYVAKFADGKIYEQNEQDISVVNPEKSCFFDILQEQETNPVETFALTDGARTISLHLPSGRFESDSYSFKLHDEGVPYFNKRLIFFRRRCHDMLSGEELSCKYILGWQGNVSEDTTSECQQFKIYID